MSNSEALVNDILNFADELDMLPKSGSLIVCVSGGADSMCLLYVMLEISKKRGFAVLAAHFNHGLREEESDRDETFVRKHCADIGVPLYSGSGDTRAFALKQGMGIEEAARDMRYGFFHDVAERIGAERIATAHTADDNAETVVMNLTRGAGAAGLSGIPPKRGIIIRPMLRISREEVLRYLTDHGTPFVEDSTNGLDVYTRNKLRHTVMPVLRDINPRFLEAATKAAALARDDEECLSEIADRFIEEHCKGFAVDKMALAGLPLAVSGRVARKLCGGGLSYKHVRAVLDLCTLDGPPTGLSLPGVTVYNEYGRLVFEYAPAADGFVPIHPEEGDCVAIPGLGLEMSCKSVVCSDRINKSLTSFLFKYDEIYGKITVRPRREGDAIRVFGRNGTKTLKKLFIEHHVPARERSLVPVIADDAGVLAVYEIGIGDRAVPAPGDLAFEIEFRKGLE